LSIAGIIRSAQPLRGADRSLVVELAGLAGAGKSSLTRALAGLDPEIRARPRVSWARYLACVPPLVPTLLSLHWPFRGVLRKEMKRVLRLQALNRLSLGTRDGRTLLFDEGPVYMLARILVFGGQNVQTHGFQRWWRHAIARWAETLDVIIWLEASDDLLAARLRTRPEHPFGDVDDRAVSALLCAYREAFTRVIGELTAAAGPRVWTVPTDRGSVDSHAQELLARLRVVRGTARRVREIA
jgi:shikimate kinase